jgi:ketosteroid isomerase-like protein
MSQENVDRIRRAYEVWNESGPAAVTNRLWAEDAVYQEGPGWPDAGVYRGWAAALERMQRLIDLLGPIAVHLDQLIDVGDGRFVACMTGPERLRPSHRAAGLDDRPCSNRKVLRNFDASLTSSSVNVWRQPLPGGGVTIPSAIYSVNVAE